MLSEIQRRVRKRESFAFETTLSGHVYARMIPEWKTVGYRMRLIFLSLPNPEMAISRVLMRVAQGGHNVSSAVVRRRFAAGLNNFQDVYMDLVDTWEWYDNSANTPKFDFSGKKSMSRQVKKHSREIEDTLRALRRSARRALELGLQMGTPVYVWKNNKIVDLTKEQRPAKKAKSKRSSR